MLLLFSFLGNPAKDYQYDEKYDDDTYDYDEDSNGYDEEIPKPKVRILYQKAENKIVDQ
jgi:hypothetical protein